MNLSLILALILAAVLGLGGAGVAGYNKGKTDAELVAKVAMDKHLSEDREAETKAKDKGAGFLVGLHFHDLRHEALSRLAEQGWSATEIAAVSGHRTLALVQRYVHHRPEALAAKLA